VANLLSATLDSFDRIDILVNASRQILTTDPLDPTDGSVQTLLDQNMFAALRLSQAVANRMIAQAEEDGSEDGPVGSIVNISSIAARRTHPICWPTRFPAPRSIRPRAALRWRSRRIASG
jgi:7-alpha-hydroxysteroid dehydrogenase